MADTARTVDDLAAKAGVTREIMLRRIATMIQKRPWRRRVAFAYAARRARGGAVLPAFCAAVLEV